MNIAARPHVPWLWPLLLGAFAIAALPRDTTRPQPPPIEGRVGEQPAPPALATPWPAVLPCTRFRTLWVGDENADDAHPHTLDAMHWGTLALDSPTWFTEIPLDRSFVPGAFTTWSLDAHPETRRSRLFLTLHCADNDGWIGWRCIAGDCEVEVSYAGAYDVCVPDRTARDALAHLRRPVSTTGSALAFAGRIAAELDGALAFACAGHRCDASAIDALLTVRRLREHAPSRLAIASAEWFAWRKHRPMAKADLVWRAGPDELRIYCLKHDDDSHSCQAEVFTGARRVLIWSLGACHEPAQIEIDETDPIVASSYVYVGGSTVELSRSARMAHSSNGAERK
jgi:hypothetical protein